MHDLMIFIAIIKRGHNRRKIHHSSFHLSIPSKPIVWSLWGYGILGSTLSQLRVFL